MAIKTQSWADPYQWNRWFAWRPVTVAKWRVGPTYFRKRAWWVWVERKEILVAGGWDSYTAYREIEESA